MLVLLAAYCASLTSFLTVPSVKVQEIKSPADLVSLGQAACWDSSQSYLKKYSQQSHLGLQMKEMVTSTGGGEDPQTLWPKEIQNGGCPAVTLLLPDYERHFRANTDYCGIEAVGSPVRLMSAGFITNKESPCVSQTLDYHLQTMVAEGDIRKLTSKWLPTKICTDDDSGDTLHAMTPSDVTGVFSIFAGFSVIMIVARFLRAYKHGEFAEDYKVEDNISSRRQKARADTLHLARDHNDSVWKAIEGTLSDILPQAPGHGEIATQTESPPIAAPILPVDGTSNPVEVKPSEAISEPQQVGWGIANHPDAQSMAKDAQSRAKDQAVVSPVAQETPQTPQMSEILELVGRQNLALQRLLQAQAGKENGGARVPHMGMQFFGNS